MAGLGSFAQQDFSAGMVRAVAPHLIPDNGFYDGVNLLLNADGSPYKRGGTAYKSSAAFGLGLRFIWDGYLAGGARTVFASASKFGTLAADDTTTVDVSAAGWGLSAPVRPAVLFGVMYLPGGKAYGGSRLSASYSTGTVTVTNGSKAVTGAGTSWTANVDAGSLIRVNGAGPLYAVASVDSNTTLTLATEYLGATAAGLSYSASPTATFPGRTGGAVYAAAANRLVSGEGSRVYFSAISDPSSFSTTDFHELPGGAQVTGLEFVQNSLLVFTTRGLWAINNFAYDLTDAFGNIQQSFQKVNDSLVLWGHQGVAGYRNGLIVPTVDGVWLVDSISAPTPLALSIAPMIREYSSAGYKPGMAAVHNNHYFLPILDGSNLAVDCLVCRLDRPTKTRLGTVFPWTRWEGLGGTVAGFANRITDPGREPRLLGAMSGTGSRVLSYDALTQDVSHTSDADTSTPSWTLITRDYPTDGQRPMLTKKTRVRYEQLASSGVTADFQLAVGDDARPMSALWGSFNWGTGTWGDLTEPGFASVDGDAPVDQGDTPYVWPVNRRSRHVRFRFAGDDPTLRMVLRSVELFVRAGGRQ